MPLDARTQAAVHKACKRIPVALPVNDASIHQHFIEISSGLSPDLSNAIARIGPLSFEVDHSRSLAERLCRSVAGQQLSVKAAASIWARVLEAADSIPLTEFFVDANAQALRACGLSAGKVRALIGIAGEDRAGGLDTEALAVLDHEARSSQLTALWGVGQWTADMISIFHFGDQDVWPDGDVSARKTLERLTSRRRKTTRTAARFAPHRSRLALYMWRHADAAPA
jgi:DNA-3-methyladenine glycosylase II